jgi:hypothetical protein
VVSSPNLTDFEKKKKKNINIEAQDKIDLN